MVLVQGGGCVAVTKRINTAHKGREPHIPQVALRYTLPFPPTVNTYWRRVGNKTILSADARKYRDDVVERVMLQRQGDNTFGSDERLAVGIRVYPPDKRRRDLDNLPKGVLDALKYAGVYGDDSQIDQLMITREESEVLAGIVVVWVEPIVRVL